MDAAEVIDSSPIGGFQIGIFVLCALVAAIDGLDTQAVGFVAPLLAAAIKIKMANIGPVFSAALAGGTVGAMVFGPVADRFGRKWPLVVACLIFAAFTLATLWVQTLPQLLALRFLAGLGLGGAAPSFLAMGAEYAPRRRRTLTVAALYAAFPLGAALGGLAASYLFKAYGWKSMFVIGGVAPVIIAGLIAVLLPESLRFLIAKGARPVEIKRILQRIAPKANLVDVEIRHSGSTTEKADSRIAGLFTDGRAPITLILWVVFFLGFTVVLTLTTWTPTLLKVAKVPIELGARALAVNNMGGVVGALVGGHLLKKFGPHLVLAPQMILGGLALFLFGSSAHSIPQLMVTSVMCGLFVGGSISVMLSLAAAVYPTVIRSTGIGWAMGVGRLGQILGPLAIGVLLARHVPVPGLFLAMGIPCAIGGLAVLCLIPLRGRMDFGRTAPEPTIDQFAAGAPES